ncbi:HPr family phosphocarrier protein [Anaerosporobacter faecicola]|uniref:HPr family phosphocarrier protein n=1 Tax=Anaerosporobacter faecicola TaxID=2718714 RepID=UPI00143A3BF5|nr:HPr family phosphocarrier protein [Anaerosporobacter faecicola]
MEAVEIKLQAPEDVKELVSAAEKCDFDIDVIYQRIIVDAKSFLGVLSMGLQKSLTVSCHGYDEAFSNTLKKYAVM